MGSWLFFWVCCVTILGIPIAVLYLLNGTIRIEEDVNDPERLAAYYCVRADPASRRIGAEKAARLPLRAWSGGPPSKQPARQGEPVHCSFRGALSLGWYESCR